MDQAAHNKIVSFIWGIADDVLRDLFKRGKYPDVILPMCVIRRMDAVLEPTKQKVLDTKKMLDEAGITEQRAALCDAAGQAFYNTSKFTLRDLKSRGSQQQLLADFEDYLNGFSPNVQDILENFKFRNQLQTLSRADAIGTLINKFLDPDIDLSPAGIDNHSMGTVFEELVRKFNEENNEEAGEHWTPRDAVRLMANLVFLPIEAEIKSGTYLLYDCACGTGGMLTVGEETLTEIGAKRAQQIKCLLYGQEINPETYAVCKADMLLKGEGESADHIVGGAEWSTLSHDAFPAQEFDFMLANPPYGKSWKKDLEAMGGKEGMRDPRFKVMHKGEELFCRTYGFLSSVIPYSNAEWEKLSILLNLLTPKLPAPEEEDLAKGILEAIDMDSYRVEKKAVMKIALVDENAEIEPVPTDGGGGKPEPELDRLSNIIKNFNEVFGTLFTDSDRVVKRIREDIAPKVAADIAYQNAKENTPHTARLAHDQALDKVMQALLKDDTHVYKQFVENESFKRFVRDMVYGLTSNE
jgi:type I restriction enzyme M protein